MKKVISFVCLISILISSFSSTLAYSNKDEKKQIAILKFDDLRPYKDYFNRFDDVKNILDKYGIKAGFGAIVSEFESCDDIFYERMKEWADDGFEIWNHGYKHSQEEFSTNSYETQKELMQKTTDVIKEKTGIEMVTFGSPYNNASKTFVEMVTKEFPDYETLLLVNESAKSDKLFINNYVSIEENGQPNFDFFEYSYDSNFDVFVIQSHPPYFTDEGLKEYEKAIKFLVDKGVVFMTPHQYYEYYNRKNPPTYSITFDDVKSAFEVPMTPGSKLSIDRVLLDSSVKRGNTGNSIKVMGRKGMDDRLKFTDAVFNTKKGTKYYISMWATVSDDSLKDSGYFYIGIYSPEHGKWRAIYNDNDADAKCGAVLTKNKWTKIGMLYTVEDEEANIVGIEQMEYKNLTDVVDINIDDVSVIKVYDDFKITDLPQQERRAKNTVESFKIPKIAILKLDDLKPTDNSFEHFIKTKEILDKYGIKAGFGLIGEGFENCDEKYYDKLKEWANDGIEIWHHGYYHTGDEYKGSSYNLQLENFKKAHDAIINNTGIEMVTFGAPGYNADETFVKMITNEFPSYETMLTVQKHAKSDKLFLNNLIYPEKEVGNPLFDSFLEEYNAKKYYDMFLLQMHAAYFDDNDLSEFEKIIKYLIDDGVLFMTPHEYYEYYNSIKIIIDGEMLNLDVYPIIKRGRTLVPLRAIFEKFGASLSYDDATRTVTISKNGTMITLTINSDKAFVNGKEVTLDIPSEEINGRTLVPIRFISETLGKTVEWDEVNEFVIIK